MPIPHRSAAAAAAALLALAPAAAGAGEAVPTVEERVERVLAGLAHAVELAGLPPARMALADRMAAHRVPGVSLAVIDGGRLAWARAFGVREAGADGRPVTVDTLFQVASLSKPVAAAAALSLVDDGRLGLDEPIGRHLRTWQLPAAGQPDWPPVTLRRLLSHSAGFTNGSVGVYRPGEPAPTLLQALAGEPPSTEPPARVEYAPGTRRVYSGGGYTVLQQLLADLSGEDLDTLARRTVFGPADMRQSSFRQPLPAGLAGFAASGHDASGAPLDGRWRVLPEAAAGGLWSTAADLARFLVAVLDAGSGRSDRLLPPALARHLLEEEIDGWSLGLETATVAGARRVRHTGSNPGFRAELIAFPATGQGAVVLTNGDGGDGLRGEILRAVAREYGWPQEPPRVRREVALSRAATDALLGVYDYGGGYLTRVEREGDRLVARLDDGRPVPLHAAGELELFTLEGTTYTFRRGEGGAVVGLEAQFGDHRLPAERRP